MKLYLMAAAAVTALAFAGAASASVVLGTETSSGGFTGQLPVGGTTITVASDGESAFGPFGITHDTSDAIQLDSIWQAAKGNQWENWGNGVWDLPACDASGVCENGNVNEPAGVWIAPGYSWSGSERYLILEALADGGGLSDTIRVFNLGDGTAAISFQSGAPEPATWAMMILGVGLVGFAARRRPAAVAA